MAIHLVRESSETPNITNKDDARMIRYAYGGYDGIVKNYGTEIALDPTTAGQIKLGSGRIVCQGWEVDIDEAGWILNFSGVTGTRYYVIYLEINLTLETAEIKSVYATGAYPEVSLGDDLTKVPSGTGRLPIMRIKVVDGRLSEGAYLISKIQYQKELRQGLENGNILVHTAKYDTDGNDIAAKFAELEDFMTKTYYGSVTLKNHIGNNTIRNQSIQKLGNKVRLTVEFNKSTSGVALPSNSITVLWSVNLPQGFIPEQDIVTLPPEEMTSSYVCKITSTGELQYIQHTATTGTTVSIPEVYSIEYFI